MNFLKYNLLFVFGFLTCLLQAQSGNTAKNQLVFRIPAISLVDFAGSDRKVKYESGKGAEQIITPSTLNKTWLNYSSISEGNSSNVISANLSSGDLPPGVVIKLSVGVDVGEGAGKMGKPSGTVILTPYPQDIVVGIGSCYTGRGVKKGHQLTYSWEWSSDFEKSEIDQLEIGVIYTIATSK